MSQQSETLAVSTGWYFDNAYGIIDKLEDFIIFQKAFLSHTITAANLVQYKTVIDSCKSFRHKGIQGVDLRNHLGPPPTPGEINHLAVLVDKVQCREKEIRLLYSFLKERIATFEGMAVNTFESLNDCPFDIFEYLNEDMFIDAS